MNGNSELPPDIRTRPMSDGVNLGSSSSQETHEKASVKDALVKKREVRRFAVLEEILRSFRPSERLALYTLSIILGASVFVLLAQLNASVSVIVPTRGGSFVEGEVGTARFINPVLATSQSDQDLAALVYSGLMRAIPHGEIVSDLASSYTISDDGTKYTFTLSPNAKFHDGTKVNSADVLYTVQAAQNPAIKSPRRADWEGVTVSAPDDHTVIFTLPHAYAPFIFNTTLGILPKDLWQTVTADEFPFSQLNTHPIGSGPYRVSSVTADKTGAATRYDLSPFDSFSIGAPFLKKISFIYYSNQQNLLAAFNARTISALSGISPSDLSSLKRTDTYTYSEPLPRVFGIFFNQGHAPALADASVRAALDAAVDKNAIVAKVLRGHGVAIDGPIPPGVLGVESRVGTSSVAVTNSPTSASSTPATGVDKARAILSKGGWVFDQASATWTNKKKQALSFTLATADEPELTATANAVATAWRAAGVQVKVQVYSLSELNTNVIRPRAYDAILFGEVVGREGDLFAFWHSSQRNDPGLNLAMYANAKADAFLAQARATTDQKKRDQLYEQFATVVQKDTAAVFLYSPDFLYVVPADIKGIRLGALTTPAERFLNVYEWYRDTERVWEIFSNKNQY